MKKITLTRFVGSACKFFLTTALSVAALMGTAQTGAVWTSGTTGTLNGIPFTVTNISGASIGSFDFSTPDFAAAPLSSNQQCVNYEGQSDFTITFDSPVTNFKLYPKYWRMDTYTFDQSFTVSSGPGLTQSENTIICNTLPYADGVISFLGPITSLTVTSNQPCCSSQAFTIGAGSSTPPPDGTAPPTPGAITGTYNVCSTDGRTAGGITYSISPVTGATSYNWTVPTGATITSGTGTTSIDVIFPTSFTNGYVSVSATNAYGTSGIRSFHVIKAVPDMPGTITGPYNVCSTNLTGTYSIAAVTGAASYTWVVPTGATITSGAGTTSIDVTFPASFTNGYISVVSTDACGSSNPRSFHVIKAIPAMPGTITGPYNVCSTNLTGTYSIAAVSGAASYTWVVPTGATITSGAGTTSIDVTFPASFTNGYITVAASSTCGSSSPRSFHVIKAVPATPGAITGTTRICGPAPSVYSIAAVTGAAAYIWYVSGSGPQPSILGGQGTTSVFVSFPAGFVGTNLSVVAADNCGTSSPRTLRILNCTYPASFKETNSEDLFDEASTTQINANLTAGVDELNSTVKYDVYPNPNNGSFKLSFKNTSSETATIQVINTLGQVVYSEVSSSTNDKEIKLEGVIKGIYLISVQLNGTITTKRIIVQ